MKKILVMSAFVAISAAFVACSSNDDLVQAPTAPEETIDEGTPLTIKVTDATRGTDITASNLQNLYLYSVTHDTKKVNEENVYVRWLGKYEEGESIPETFTKDGEGKLVSGETINWPEGTDGYDFYALSDATFASESDGGEGTQKAEHFDASPRTFTYTVTNDYANQKDLLVGSALNQKATTDGGNVTIPLMHALARVKSIKLAFKPVSNTSNDNYIFLIKSMTLKNIPCTGTFAFPSEALEIDRSDPDKTNHKDNVTTAWTAHATEATDFVDYTFVLPDFQRDTKGRIIVFDEDETSSTDPYEYEMIAYHPETSRAGISGFPNYINFPDGTTTVHEFPLETAANSGLYLLPQTLQKTSIDIDDSNSNAIKYQFNNSGEHTPYLEIRFLGLTDSNHSSSSPEALVNYPDVSADFGGELYSQENGYWTNQKITDAIDNDDLCTVRIPLTSIKLEASKACSIKAYINLAVNHDDDDLMIFAGAGLDQ